MRTFDNQQPPVPVTGRMGLVIKYKDGSTERIDMGVVKEGFYAPIPGDRIEHEGVSYEVSGVADTPESDISIHVVAEEK
jgi:hypothetical protein